MIEKEYFSVTEISKLKKMSTRNVRIIISKLKESKDKTLLYKDKLNQWCIHHLLLSEFERKRTNKDKLYALNIDPSHSYSEKDINKIMQFAFEKTEETQHTM